MEQGVSDPAQGGVDHLPTCRAHAQPDPCSAPEQQLERPIGGLLHLLEVAVDDAQPAFQDQPALVKPRGASRAGEGAFERPELRIVLTLELQRQPGELGASQLALEEVANALAQTFISGTSAAAWSGAPVARWISSADIPGARSFSFRPAEVTSITA